jgi:diacylglycerol kinase
MSMINKHLKSYQYAFRGILLGFRNDPNMALHFLAAAGVVVLNFILDVSRTDWLITLMLIGVVMMSELFNTAIEKLADRITTNHDELIGKVKDIAAGAVMIICIVAVVCAGIVYYPYLR